MMRSERKTEKWRIPGKWTLIFLLILLAFYGYQNILAENYERQVVSWIGQTEKDRTVSAFTEPDEEAYQKGCEALKEAMENVLKNAVEYADTGSLIQILLKEDTDYYKLYITNLGKRIEEEKRELIFDRFYQMEQGSGIGIGLHLAREIVTLHQGTLKVVDRSGLEEATTFQFILPKMIAKDHAQEEINLTIS